MRILFVNRSARFQGGIESDIHAAAQGLAERGHRCRLLAFDPATDPEYERVFEETCVVPWRKDLPREALQRAVRAFEPDVVYLHKVEDASELAAHELPVPVVRIVHDHDLYCMRRHRYLPVTLEVCTRPADVLGCMRCGGFFERARDGVLPLRWRPVTARLKDLDATRRLSRVLVASRFMATELERNGIAPDLVHVVPLGVPDRPLPPPPERPDRLLYVGQVLRTKGLDLLLRALAKLPPDVTLDVVGSGPQRDELIALGAELGLGERVTWHGFMRAEQLGALFDKSSIVTFPSRWPEPFGLVGLEAMRAARPVAAFDTGGVSEWLTPDRTGLLVEPGSVAGMARALHVLVSQPDLARTLGNNGRSSFERTFTLDKYLDRLERQLVQVTLQDAA